jgi:flagellar FliL protein
MAKNEESKQEDQDDVSSGSASMVKTIIVSAVVALLVGGGVVAGNYFLVSSLITEQLATNSAGSDGDGAGDNENAVPMEPPQYLSMDPKFVVGFNDQQQSRFMQFSLEIMTRDSEVIKQVELHMPAIRSSLLMLFGIQAYQEMITREGKEKLLQDVATDINSVLQKASGKEEVTAAVEAAYFNSFVIQ